MREAKRERICQEEYLARVLRRSVLRQTADGVLFTSDDYAI